jgi:hypothetical protein
MHDAPPPRARCASVIFTNSVIADLHHHVLSPATLTAAFRRHDCLTARSTHPGCVCMYVFCTRYARRAGPSNVRLLQCDESENGRAVCRLRDMTRASRLGAQCGGFLAYRELRWWEMVAPSPAGPSPHAWSTSQPEIIREPPPFSNAVFFSSFRPGELLGE